MASSRDGVHLAKLRIDAPGRGELGLCVLMSQDSVKVRIWAPGAEAEAWLVARTPLIERALEETGVTLTELQIGCGDGRGTDEEQPGDDGLPCPPASPRRTVTAPWGWTL